MKSCLPSAAAVLVMAVVLGCDEKPQVRRSYAPATAPAAEREATWQDMPIPNAPATMQVPPKWDLQVAASAMFLEGPISSSILPIHIQLLRQPPVGKEVMRRLMAEDQAGKTGQLKMFQTRQEGPLTIADKRVVEPAMGANIPAAMKWTVTLYLARDEQHVVPYHLMFLDLTLPQYEKDRSVLERMVSSIRYVGPTTQP